MRNNLQCIFLDPVSALILRADLLSKAIAVVDEFKNQAAAANCEPPSPYPLAVIDDEEVSPERCQDVARRSIAAGSKIDVVVHPGATHDFSARRSGMRW
ncbi:hypothetical protein AAFG07_23735 [Bradyrhizobium sp. B097]|uniref:hypothetical protein n=1 Tax=Bradyrhizobium sp. B097 TaxID=3140244 RepID=UPI0031830B26